MSTSVSKAKKVVKKTVKKPDDPVAAKPKISIAELETSTILDNDYRNILSAYVPTKNKSRPIISIYERTLLIGKRATQIAYGANPLISVEPGMNEVAIAEEELRQRKIPLIIKRTIGDHTEYWKPGDMILP